MAKRDRPAEVPPALLTRPFAGLAERLGFEPKPAPPPEVAPAKAPARAVVRLERAGRRGRQVTVVEGLGLGPDELARWLRELKVGLSCGGAVEGEALVLQGDQRERVRTLLESRGVGRVVG